MPHIEVYKSGNEVYFENGKALYYKHITSLFVRRIVESTHPGFICRDIEDKQELEHAKECFAKVTNSRR